MRFRKKGYLLAILILLLSFVGCNVSDLYSNVQPATATGQTAEQVNINNDGMTVHYIDVGQGDSELIQVGDKNMIDSLQAKNLKINVLRGEKEQLRLMYILQMKIHMRILIIIKGWCKKHG